MKKILASLFAAFAMFASSSAFAYTDCSNTTIIRTYTYETGGVAHFVAGTAVGVGFDIASTSPIYKEVVGMAHSAKNSGATISLRFTAGISCATYTYRTDLEIFFNEI